MCVCVCVCVCEIAGGGGSLQGTEQHLSCQVPRLFPSRWSWAEQEAEVDVTPLTKTEALKQTSSGLHDGRQRF